MINLEEIKSRWEPLLAKPDWYLSIVPEIDEIKKNFEGKSEAEQDACKKELYDFFELHLKNGDIALEQDPPTSSHNRNACNKEYLSLYYG